MSYVNVLCVHVNNFNFWPMYLLPYNIHHFSINVNKFFRMKLQDILHCISRNINYNNNNLINGDLENVGMYYY